MSNLTARFSYYSQLIIEEVEGTGVVVERGSEVRAKIPVSCRSPLYSQ